MTGKERLERLFDGREIDRIPIWLQFPYFLSPSFADVSSEPSYKLVLEKIYQYSEIIDRRGFNSGFCFNSHPEIRTERKNYKEGEYSISETVISYKDIEFKSTLKKSKDRTE